VTLNGVSTLHSNYLEWPK